LYAALFFSALAACGGKSFEAGEDPDSNPGGSNPGGSGNVAGTSAGGSVGKGGTSGKAGSGSAGTGQGGSAGASCESLDDQPGYFVSVAIMNKTAAPIHLGQDMVTCGVSPLFDVKDGSGVPLPSLGDCRSSCQKVRTQGPVGCPAACAFPSAVTLQPGEVIYTSYDGLYEVQTTLPDACVNPMFGDNQCSQARQIQPGTFTFSSRAGSTIDCSQTTGTGMCSACMPTGEGGCSTPGSLISGKMHQATTTVVLDSSYGVFGGYPAPAPALPDDPDGDSANGALALLTVELVFTD
jgi:hypothetical protein